MGYYVYLYVDPRTNRTFYVGKGKGASVLAHLSQTVKSRRRKVLKELKTVGLEPQIEVLAHALPNEEMPIALRRLLLINWASAT